MKLPTDQKNGETFSFPDVFRRLSAAGTPTSFNLALSLEISMS